MAEDTIGTLANGFGVPREEFENSTTLVVDTVMGRLFPDDGTMRDAVKLEKFKQQLQKKAEATLEIAKLAIIAETQKGPSGLVAVALIKIIQAIPGDSNFYPSAIRAAREKNLSNLQAAMFADIKYGSNIPRFMRQKLMGWTPFGFGNKDSN